MLPTLKGGQHRKSAVAEQFPALPSARQIIHFKSNGGTVGIEMTVLVVIAKSKAAAVQWAKERCRYSVCVSSKPTIETQGSLLIMGETQPAESKSESPACSAPPLGVIPKRFWVERRFWDLTEACNRYMDVDMAIPSEWIDEMREHFRTATRKADTVVVEKWRHWLSLD